MILGVFAALFLGELLARLLSLAPQPIYIEKWRMRLSDNKGMIYEPIPSMSAENHDMQYYLYPDKTNALGFRGEQPTSSKKEADPRIIVLGDSVVAGIWVPDPTHLLTSSLEEKLRKFYPQVEVLNFGVPGYNTQQELAILEDRGLKLNPDAVILAYCLNDQIMDNGGIIDILTQSESISNRPVQNWLTDRSALISAMTSVITSKATPKLREKTSETIPQSLVPSSSILLEKSFEKLRQLSQAHKFVPVVVIFPDFTDLSKAGCKDSPTSKNRDEVFRAATRSGVRVFDLCEDFREFSMNYFGEPLSYDRYHLNPLGHQVAGEILFRKVCHLLAEK